MRVPIYRSKLYIGIGTDPESCIASLPQDIGTRVTGDLKETLLAGGWDGYSLDFDDGNYAILFCDADPGIPMTVIFHEVLHTTLYMCERHGIKISSDGTEAVAHLTGWVGEQALMKVQAWRKRHRLNTSRKRGII